MGIYVFAFIPIATTTILGVYYGENRNNYYFLVLDYIVVCTVNLNGTLNCIAYVWFSSEAGKKKLEARASRLSIIALEEGSSYQQASRSRRNRGSVDTRWSNRWLPAPKKPPIGAASAECSATSAAACPPPAADKLGSVTV